MRIPAHLSKDACLGYKCFLFGVCRRGWTKSEINLFSCRARGTRSSPGVICFSISCTQLYKSPQPSPLGQGSSTEGTWMANTGLHEISGIPQNMCRFSRGDCMAYISSYQKQIKFKNHYTQWGNEEWPGIGRTSFCCRWWATWGVKNHETPSLFLNHESQNISIAFPLGNWANRSCSHNVT